MTHITIRFFRKGDIAVAKNIKSNKGCVLSKICNWKNIAKHLDRIKSYNRNLYKHSIETGKIAIKIGQQLGLSEERLLELGLGAILHDIGKIFLDKRVLLKPGKLSVSERRYVQEHPIRGYQYLGSDKDIPLIARVAVLHHHEKYGGSGYPAGVKGDDIALPGRIIAVADVYNAMTSSRPYCEPLCSSIAREYIENSSGTHFDPQVAETFLALR